MRLALLGDPGDALPPLGAVLLALVPVLPFPEGDLPLISVGGADTGMWLPLALAKRVSQLVVGGGRDIREGG